MKNRRSLRKALASITLAAVLLTGTGCTKAAQADITAKSNTERLEDAAVVTLAYTPASRADLEAPTASQTVLEEPTANAAKAVSSGRLRYDEVAVPASPLYDLLGASTRYSVELAPASDVVKIVVDADVYVPDTDKLPTLRVTPRDFTQDEVTRLFHALCGDTVMYKALQEMTRSEVAERIADVEAELQTATDKDRIKKLQSNLAYWQEDYEKAPKTVSKEISDGTLEERQLGIQEYLGKYMALDAYEHQDGYYTYWGKSFHVHGETYDKNKKSGYDFPVGANIWYTRDQSFGKYLNYNVRTWIVDESAVPADAVGLNMTPADARKLVETFWKDSGFEDMAVSGVYLVCNSAADHDYSSEKEDPYAGCHAYVVTCCQSIAGRLTLPADSGDPHWGFESCTFTVTDNGIESFQWYSPYAYGEVTTDSSALITFDRIDEIFQKMMLVKYDLSNTNDLVSATYRVDRVALEMSRVTNRKSSEKGLLVPVWNFYGTFDFVYENGHTYSSGDLQGFPNPLLRINAIDGTVIEPRYGC